MTSTYARDRPQRDITNDQNREGPKIQKKS